MNVLVISLQKVQSLSEESVLQLCMRRNVLISCENCDREIFSTQLVIYAHVSNMMSNKDGGLYETLVRQW